MSTASPAGDPCIYCGEPTAFGSGRFVNRIPADRELDDGTMLDGWMCEECQQVECDRCGELTVDYLITDDGKAVCPECAEGGGADAVSEASA